MTEKPRSLAFLQADDLLVEGGREHAGAHEAHTGLARQRAHVLAVLVGRGDLEVGVGVGLHLGVGVGVLELMVVVAQRLDLLVDFSLGRAFGRKLHFDRLVIGEFAGRLALDLEGELVGLATLDERRLAELGLADGIQIAAVDSERIAAVHDVIGDAGRHSLGAERVVDDRTGRLALAESGEIVLIRKVLVSLLDAIVDFFGIDGDGHLDLVVLQCLYFCFH